MTSEEPKWPLISWGIAFFCIGVTQVVLYFLHQNPAISEKFLAVYFSDLGWKALAISGFMFFYQILENFGLSISLIEFEEDNNPLDSVWAKLGVTIFFSLLMLIPLTTMHSTVLPIPKTINEGFSLDPVTSTVLNSWVPGWFEDLTYLFALPYIVFLVMGFLAYLIFKIDFREDRLSYWVMRIMGILVGVLIFVSAHGGEDGVYGRDLGAYVSAFVFGIAQSMIYALTGLPLPLAHIFHNAVVSLGFVTGLSIGGAPLLEMLFLRIKLGSSIRRMETSARRSEVKNGEH